MKSLNTKTILKMIEFGSNKISENFEYINDLNVFPVPDGDTGINMKTSIIGAYEMVKNMDDITLFEFAKNFNRQLLMNARGNSGVIFSQIFRGFFDPIKEGQNELSFKELPDCFLAAKERSYKSVSSPIEGTILTLIRMLSEEIQAKKDTFNDVKEIFSYVEKRSFEIVEMTPDMLPSLKESGVVDSGAYGLAIFFQGMYEAIDNGNTNELVVQTKKIVKKTTPTKKVSFIDSPERQEIYEEGFGYCCEFICQLNYKLFPEQVKKSNFNMDSFEKELLSIGNSLVLVLNDDLVKVHIHTFEPYRMLEIGQKYGEFLKIKIENMTEQFFEKNSEVPRNELLKSMKLSDKTKIIVTVPTQKYGKFLKSEFGISTFINTEKTGNPSINDFINKIEEVKSKNIIIIIDDSNIILSAEQAIQLKSNNINFLLIKARNPLEMMSALMSLEIEADFKTNLRYMNKAIQSSKIGMISTSVKTLKTKKGLHVQKGNYIGIENKEIISSNENIVEASINLIKKIIGKEKPKLIYLLQGKDTNGNDISKIEKFINEQYGIKCKKILGEQKTFNLYFGF